MVRRTRNVTDYRRWGNSSTFSAVSTSYSRCIQRRYWFKRTLVGREF